MVQQKRNARRLLLGKSEGKRPLERPRCRWENIKINLRTIGCSCLDWIYLAQDCDKLRALVNTAMDLLFP
jgi:hypothetical protein